jgi:phosphatidate cytidylyltransferase
MKRLVTSVIGLTVLYLIMLNTFVLAMTMAVLFFIGAKEFAIIMKKGWGILIDFAVLSPASFFILPPVFEWRGITPLAGTATAVGVLGVIALLRTYVFVGYSENKKKVFYACLFVGMYLGFLPSHLLYVRAMENGFNLALIIVLTVASVDIAAYAIGKAAQKAGKSHQLSKASPKKTWEGSIAGLLAGALLPYILVKVFGMETGIAPYSWILLGAILSVVAQYGDYFESKLKRKAVIKDSGGIIPGHGGVLDRFDGHIAASPVAYYMVVFLTVIQT